MQVSSVEKFGRNPDGSENERPSDSIGLQETSTLIDQRDEEARISSAAHWLVIESEKRL
jgi:hypothetical protein